MTLLETLRHHGPLTKRQLAARLADCTCRSDTCVHKRDIEEQVRALVLAGHLIYATGAGYDLATGPDDPALDHYEAWLEGKRERMGERLAAIRAARRSRRSQGVQEGFGWAA